MATLTQLDFYHTLNQALQHQQIGITASELHGLIAGILCGGNQDSSWLPLVYSLANDDHAFQAPLNELVQQLYEQTRQSLAHEDFSFQLLIPAEGISLFEQITDLAGWANHFLLGLGVTVAKLDTTNSDVTEILQDLRSIGQLGFDEEEPIDQLERSFTEVKEYTRTAAMICYHEFNDKAHIIGEDKPILH